MGVKFQLDKFQLTVAEFAEVGPGAAHSNFLQISNEPMHCKVMCTCSLCCSYKHRSLSKGLVCMSWAHLPDHRQSTLPTQCNQSTPLCTADETLSRLLQGFASQLAQVQALQGKAQEGFSSLVAYFGENPSSFSADSSFWKPISEFAQALSAAQRQE